MLPPIDRIETLGQRDDIVGIDFVYVSEDQVNLFVFFHPSLTLNAQQILGAVTADDVRIYSPGGGERLAEVALDPAFPPLWVTRANRRVLQVRTIEPGDFSRYRLRLDLAAVDPYFREARFSFKANCPSELDCEPRPHECPEEELVDAPVNYQARDFWSIRQALLDFASERHPDWKDRLEADAGMMLVEVMSALGDEHAYYQDRIARESYFETAAQRRSARRHARMVDYHLHDGQAGTTWLDFTVDNTALMHVIGAGTPVWVAPLPVRLGETAGDRLRRSPSVYEVGHGLMQGHTLLAPPLGVALTHTKVYQSPTFNLRFAANELNAYQWDDNDACLPIGSTVLYVQGQHAPPSLTLAFEDFTNPDVPGKWVVLQADPADASVPARSWLVRLIRVTNEIDPLTLVPLSRLEWEPAQATPFELEMATLVVRGNIVPATAGETLEARFRIEPNPQALVPPPPPPAPAPASNIHYTKDFSGYAIERSARLFTLPGSEERDVVWHGRNGEIASPEVRVMDVTAADEWEWKRALLGVSSSQANETHFTLDDGSWRRVAGYRRVDEGGTPREFVHYDYADGRGTTVQFGNGVFGQVPARGTDFRTIYRLGHGRADNIAADSLDDYDPVLLPFVDAVSNPFDVLNAVDPESLADARHVAPDAWRAETFRAVRAEDYAAAAEKLPWVQRAGAQFRWTGSWLTLFATPDPKGTFALTADQRRDLEQQLDRYRLAGRETHAMDPRFANLDLEIRVCVAATSYAGDVKELVLQALFGRRGVRARPGFFSPDHWTFGDPLERAQLEAVIQAVPGVRAVEEIYIRRRGWFAKRLFSELVYRVAPDVIIRVENDPDLPERGAVRLVMEGGA